MAKFFAPPLTRKLPGKRKFQLYVTILNNNRAKDRSSQESCLDCQQDLQIFLFLLSIPIALDSTRPHI